MKVQVRRSYPETRGPPGLPPLCTIPLINVVFDIFCYVSSNGGLLQTAWIL
jgi:hypothetical protein